jgi:hypothetical protein
LPEQGEPGQEEIMAQISCGCTPQQADATCERGSKLFAAASQAFHDLSKGTAPLTNARRQTSTLAHRAYLDHLRGWQEGDRKVLRRRDTWMVYVRLSGEWVFHFETSNDTRLQEWLALKGYQQFVKGGGKQAQDQLAGYYRTIAVSTHSLPPLELVDSPGTSPSSSESLAGLDMPASAPFPSSVDLKTRIAVSLALHVARIPHTPTLLDRLHLQQHATKLLLAHGIPIGPRDGQTLRALIDEAIQQNEEMKATSKQQAQEFEK